MSKSIDVKMFGVEEVKMLLSGVKNGAAKAITRSINRAISSTTAKAGKLVRKDLNVSVADGKRGVETKKATYSKLSGSFKQKNKPYPFILDKKVMFGGRKLKKSGYSLQIKKSKGRKKIKRAFYLRTTKGYENIFVRYGRGKKDIKAGYTTSPTDILRNPAVTDELNKHAADTVQKRLEHETGRLLK